MYEERSTTGPHLLEIVGRLVLGGLAGLSGAFLFGMAAMAGCCDVDPEGWYFWVGSIGLSSGLAAWSVVIVARQRMLPWFCLGGIGFAMLVLLV